MSYNLKRTSGPDCTKSRKFTFLCIKRTLTYTKLYLILWVIQQLKDSSNLLLNEELTVFKRFTLPCFRCLYHLPPSQLFIQKRLLICLHLSCLSLSSSRRKYTFTVTVENRVPYTTLERCRESNLNLKYPSWKTPFTWKTDSDLLDKEKGVPRPPSCLFHTERTRHPWYKDRFLYFHLKKYF